MILWLLIQTFQIIDTLLSHLISVLYIPLSLPLFSAAFNFLITVFILCWKILVSQQPSLAKQVCSDPHRVQQGSPSLRIVSSLWIFNFRILQNRTFPKLSGIFTILYDFSNSLPVALRLYVQILFALCNVICLNLEV